MESAEISPVPVRRKTNQRTIIAIRSRPLSSAIEATDVVSGIPSQRERNIGRATSPSLAGATPESAKETTCALKSDQEEIYLPPVSKGRRMIFHLRTLKRMNATSPQAARNTHV